MLSMVIEATDLEEELGSMKAMLERLTKEILEKDGKSSIKVSKLLV